MYIRYKHGPVYFIKEVRLCRMCFRTFELNDASYVMFTYEGMMFYTHAVCPDLKYRIAIKLGKG